MNKFSKSFDKPVKDITPDALSALLKYHWPGNVRELENKIERAVILCDGDILNTEHFQITPEAKQDMNQIDHIFEGYSLKNAQKIMEKELITRALNKTGGNRTRASQLLEISHPSLLSKIKSYDIDL
jgi:two-component system response regulator AtoC